MEKPVGTFSSKFGEITYGMPSTTFAHLNGEVKVNGVCYSMTFRIKVKDGRWTEDDWSEPYLRRQNGEPTMNAKETLRKHLLPQWEELLREQPDLMHNAAIYSAEVELNRAENEADELAEALDKALKNVKLKKQMLEALV